MTQRTAPECLFFWLSDTGTLSGGAPPTCDCGSDIFPINLMS
jgi:hypothetical protein